MTGRLRTADFSETGRRSLSAVSSHGCCAQGAPRPTGLFPDCRLRGIPDTKAFCPVVKTQLALFRRALMPAIVFSRMGGGPSRLRCSALSLTQSRQPLAVWSLRHTPCNYEQIYVSLWLIGVTQQDCKID